jgi:hypothetical protein
VSRKVIYYRTGDLSVLISKVPIFHKERRFFVRGPGNQIHQKVSRRFTCAHISQA